MTLLELERLFGQCPSHRIDHGRNTAKWYKVAIIHGIFVPGLILTFRNTFSKPYQELIQILTAEKQPEIQKLFSHISSWLSCLFPQYPLRKFLAGLFVDFFIHCPNVAQRYVDWIKKLAQDAYQKFIVMDPDFFSQLYYDLFSDSSARKEQGQFFTSQAMAAIMANLAKQHSISPGDVLRALEPAAGTGILALAIKTQFPQSEIDLLESDPILDAMARIQFACHAALVCDNSLDYQQIWNQYRIRLCRDSLSLLRRGRNARQRYHLVIANPPYIGYNQASKQKNSFLARIQRKEILLSNIYGSNLHSLPGRGKKYAPKPNLYAFFLAQGLSLLENEGILIFLIPVTLISSQDLDTMRFQLSHFYTILGIYFASTPKFYDTRTKKAVHTSSMLLVIRNKKPDPTHEVSLFLLHADQSLEKLDVVEIQPQYRLKQKNLADSCDSWNFLLFSDHERKLLSIYQENSSSCSQYFDHSRSIQHFSSLFYFDKGVVYPKSPITKPVVQQNQGYYEISPLRYSLYLGLNAKSKFVPLADIRYPQGSQGAVLLQCKYKIIWRYMNPDCFYFSDQPVVCNYNFAWIASDHFKEMLYLWALLNGVLSRKVLRFTSSIPFEKDRLMGIGILKKKFQVPLTATSLESSLKLEFIALAERLFEIEKNLFLSSGLEDRPQERTLLRDQMQGLEFRLYKFHREWL